jgi:hypothetical protein
VTRRDHVDQCHEPAARHSRAADYRPAGDRDPVQDRLPPAHGLAAKLLAPGIWLLRSAWHEQSLKLMVEKSLRLAEEIV